MGVYGNNNNTRLINGLFAVLECCPGRRVLILCGCLGAFISFPGSIEALSLMLVLWKMIDWRFTKAHAHTHTYYCQKADIGQLGWQVGTSSSNVLAFGNYENLLFKLVHIRIYFILPIYDVCVCVCVYIE